MLPLKRFKSGKNVRLLVCRSSGTSFVSLHFSCGVTGSVELISPEVKKNLVEFKNYLETRLSKQPLKCI